MSTARATPRRAGLPIAAHLGLLVTVAVTAAFIAALAIVLLLPPRPPDVMRADQVLEQFTAAYAHAKSGAAPQNSPTLRFSIADSPSQQANSGPDPMRMRIARAIGASPQDVRFSARLEQTDRFVFRVQNVESAIQVTTEYKDGVTRIITRSPITGQIETVEVQRPIDGDPHPPRVTVRPPPPMPPPGNMPPLPPPPPAPPMFAPAPSGVMLLANFEVSAKLPNGRWLTMQQARADEWAWIARTAAAFAATLSVFGVLAWVSARRLAGTIQGFSRTVQAVGIDPHHAPVTESGPRELRDAARAINAMQARLRALIADRTKTLATVAHDMRTPLMRMRLALEASPQETRDALAKDIGDVEALVASFIAFARDDPAEEARAPLDLAALLQSVVDDQTAMGRSAVYDGPERLVITGQPIGLKRVFANVIDNAIKYGEHADVRLSCDDKHAIIDVADRGPGVAAGLREDIFKPFVRGDMGVSGAGLGLASARSIARAHGGDVVLADSMVGARFTITLPRA